MPQPWPDSLPQRFDKDGYSDSFTDNRHASQTDLGPALIRSRISYMPRRVAGVMKMNKTQLDRLRQFWKVDTLGGKLPFIFPDPVFGTGEFKNHIPNSGYGGAVAGSPGTLPTGWSGLGTQNGITKRVAEIGVEGGLEYTDIQFSGTGTTTGIAEIMFAEPPVVSSINQWWTQSAYVRLKAGAKDNISSIALVMYATPTAQNSFINFIGKLSTDSLLNQRVVHSWRPDAIGMTGISPRIQVQAAPGLVSDITLRIGGVQLENADRAYDYIPTPNINSPITRFAAGGSPPSPVFLGGRTWGVNLELEIFEL